MSNLILGNTTGEVCYAIKEGYLRLTGAFAGPTSDRLSANASSGFLIRDGNNNSGLYISNCSVKNYKDKFEFSQTSNVNNYLLTQNNQILNISGNGSLYSFSPNGTFSIGDQAYSPYSGLQINLKNPYLSLIQNSSSIDNEINYLNLNKEKTFYLSQKENSGVYLYSCNFITLGTRQCPQLLTLSGSTVSISGSGLNYGLANFSTSYFRGASLFSGNLNISGITRINNEVGVTGLRVNSNSAFCREVVFYGDTVFSGGKLLESDGLLKFKTGEFLKITGTDVSYTSGSFCCVISTGSSICNFSATNANLINLTSCNLNYKTGIYNCLLSGQNFYNCGFFCNVSNLPVYITGSYVEIDTPNTYLYTTLNLTGNSFYCGNQNVVGNFNHSGLNFNSTGLNFNICSQNINLSGSLICFSGDTSLTGISGVQNIITSGFNVGHQNTWSGFVKSLNTPKAWGMISFNCGIPTLICGYNVNTITLPITGMAASGVPSNLTYYGASGILANQGSNRHGWTNPFIMYGIALRERIMYPFHVDFTYHPTHNFDAYSRITTGNGLGASFLSCLTGIGTFSGTTCNGGPFSPPNFIGTNSIDSRNCQLIPKNFTLINCAGFGTQNFTTGCFRKLVNNECYGEIIFNLSPAWTGINFPNNYYRVGTPYISGSGSFAIYSL